MSDVIEMTAPAPAAQGAQTAPGRGPAPPPPFRPRDWLRLYQDGRHDELSEKLLEVLGHFQRKTYFAMDRRLARYLNEFMRNFLYFFSQEDYTPGNAHASGFIDLNPVIGHLAAMSAFQTTDAYLAILSGQPRNLGKLLALYSPRNRVRLDRKALFDANAPLASRWYFAYLENYKSGCASAESLARLREHIAYTDPRMVFATGAVHHAYFGCTYIDHERDCQLKQRINELFRSWPPASRRVVNRPERRKIGVFTSMWMKTHSVYRSQQPFLEELAKEYDLTLVHLGQPRSNLDTELFKEVREFHLFGPKRNFAAFDPNDFALAYFPDVGMSVESIYLSNLRIAPIQVTNYGHPVSTCGSQIDYWIAGAGTELAEGAERHYTERLVLIPGCGQISTPIRYAPEGLQPPEDHVRVACAWTGQKINAPHLQLLRQAVERARRPVKFVFFPAAAALANGFVPLARDVREALGAGHVDMQRPLEYAPYMRALERCHFAADAYPFGGYNSAVDVLYLRKPLVALQGDRFYNMASSYLLARMGLPELVARTPEEYVDRLARMIYDDDFRDEMIQRAAQADVEQALLTREHAAGFRAAIDYLLEHHEREQASGSRAPIRIG